MATEKLKMEQNGGGEADWDGLSIEVLEMIFAHVHVKDLLSCSVVSKNWKKAARDVLKRSRECYTHIKVFRQDIQALNEMIASTGLMEMANGLHIRNETKPKDDPGSTASSSRQAFRRSKEAGEKPEKVQPKVHELLQVQWRYLNLDMGSDWATVISAVNASLLRELISATSGSLEKLVIGQECDWNFIPSSGNEYSKLKVIQLLKTHYQIETHTEIFTPTCAPKLEEISGAMIGLTSSAPLDPFMMKRMKSIMIFSELEAPEGESKEAFGNISGLRKLDLQRYHWEEDEEDPDQEPQDLVSWNAFVFPFVLKSLDTLEELDLYVSDLYLLFKTSEALKFPNLRRLSLAIDSSLFFEKQISILKQLNLAKLCPNLDQVKLAEDSLFRDAEIDLIEPSEALEQSSLPVQIVLDCEIGSLGMLVGDYLTYFNSVYPNAVQVRILNLDDAYISENYSVIWEMNSLEYLEINIARPPSHEDGFPFELDALLCGINIEEAKMLCEGGPKKIATENAVIVPNRPSLFDAKSLKELKITEVHDVFGEFVKYSCVIQITDNVPVRQERQLKVTFEGHKELYDKLKQLRAVSTFRRVQVHESYTKESTVF